MLANVSYLLGVLVTLGLCGQCFRETGRTAVAGYRFIGWEPADVSYWVALLFTLGSAAWIVNGWYLFLPTGNATLDLNAAGWSGASL